MMTPDDIKRVVQGGLDRIDSPKDCKDYLWAELSALDLKPDSNDRHVNAVIRLINKIIGKGA
jgi:hypothetical protein